MNFDYKVNRISHYLQRRCRQVSIKNKDAYNSKIIIVLLYFFLFVQTQAIGATFAAMIGAGMLVRSISYEHSPVPKHLAWMLHAGV